MLSTLMLRKQRVLDGFTGSVESGGTTGLRGYGIDNDADQHGRTTGTVQSLAENQAQGREIPDNTVRSIEQDSTDREAKSLNERENDKMMKNYYDYIIAKNYDKTIFAKTVELIMQNVKDIEGSEYDEDLYDEYQIQYIKTSRGEIRVGNQMINAAVWAMSEIDLDGILKQWEDKTFYESEKRKLTSEEVSKAMQEAKTARERFVRKLKQREAMERQKKETK